MTTTQLLAGHIEVLAVSAGRGPVLLIAAVLAGLQAGTYYTWASGVMPGLARTDDRTFVDATQQMSIAIVNPVFMLSFLGAPLFACAAIIGAEPSARPWTIAGAALAVGTLVITAIGNVPLNNQIEAAAPSTPSPTCPRCVIGSKADGWPSTRRGPSRPSVRWPAWSGRRTVPSWSQSRAVPGLGPERCARLLRQRFHEISGH